MTPDASALTLAPLTVLFFTGLNAMLESFFFRRVDPVWLFFLISVFGLRLVARFEVRSGARS